MRGKPCLARLQLAAPNHEGGISPVHPIQPTEFVAPNDILPARSSSSLRLSPRRTAEQGNLETVLHPFPSQSLRHPSSATGDGSGGRGFRTRLGEHEPGFQVQLLATCPRAEGHETWTPKRGDLGRIGSHRPLFDPIWERQGLPLRCRVLRLLSSPPIPRSTDLSM